ncbi:hypothetical protein Tco_1145336 [Tanacetum coccineum]
MLLSGPTITLFSNVIQKISLAASVYFIWRERNKRLFAAEKKDWETVHNEVINTIRFKLSSVKIKSSLHQPTRDLQMALYLGIKNLSLCSNPTGLMKGILGRGNVAEWDCIPEQLLTKSDARNRNMALGDGSQCEQEFPLLL